MARPASLTDDDDDPMVAAAISRDLTRLALRDQPVALIAADQPNERARSTLRGDIMIERRPQACAVRALC
jgi:hypothetical protein